MAETLVKHVPITPQIQEYVVRYGTRQDDVLRWIVQRTNELGYYAIQQIVPEEGELLTLLTRMVDAELAIEIGTFTGYSSVCLARGLAPTGRLLCCDRSVEWTDIARQAWQMAGLADRIELRMGDALDTIRSLPADRTVDLSFVDADLRNHQMYYEELISRTRPGGLVVIDNTLLRGRVVEPGPEDSDAHRVHAFNARLAADERVDIVLVPFHDGLTLARRRD